MQTLYSVNARLQDLSRQHKAHVQNQVYRHGQQLDNYIHKCSGNLRYNIQIILRLPLIFAIHCWLLLAPYSENVVFEVFWSVVRMFVVYILARAWIFNTETLLLHYGSIILEIGIGLIEESLFWTFQNEANDVCHESRVVTWGDVDDAWWKPAFSVLFIESIYFWSHVYFKFQNLHHHHRCFLFIAFLTPVALPMFGIFPGLISTMGYYINKIRLAVVMVTGIFEMEAFDEQTDYQKLRDEIEKLSLLEGEDKSESNRRIRYLQKRVKLNRAEVNVMNNLNGNRGVRDLLLVFGLLYFGLAFMLELFWYKTANFSNLANLNFLIRFLFAWSTTPVPVITILFWVGFVATLVVGITVWFVTWEISITDALNINIEKVVQFTLITLLLESGINPTANTNPGLEGLSIIAIITAYFILHIALDLVARKILEMSNRGSRLAVCFYIRAVITLFILAVVPVIIVLLFKETWVIFFSSGSIILISNVVFLVIEWILVMLTWYTDKYLTAIENGIEYTHVAKQFSYILLLPFQFYARYLISAFKAWWLFRAVNLIVNYIFLVFVLFSQQKHIYNERKRLLVLLSGLSDISYIDMSSSDQADRVCAICFSTLEDGKLLPCTHAFHTDCLRRWFQVRTVCPTCNLEVK